MSYQLVNKFGSPGALIRLVALAVMSGVVTLGLLVLTPLVAGVLGLAMLGVCLTQRRQKSRVSPAVLAVTAGVVMLVLVYGVLAAIQYEGDDSETGSGGSKSSIAAVVIRAFR